MTDLPPLHAVRAFEAAARLLSITRAAAELHVTPAAVSRQVQALERFLGVPLLVRGHRQVSLSSAGALYFSEVTQMFARLRDVTQNLAAIQPSFNLRVAVPPTFGTRWLIPRLQPFHAAEPGVSVQLAGPAPVIGQDGIDVDIRFGDGHWPGCHAIRLTPNIVTPVCSARLQAACQAVPMVEALQRHTLLYSLTRPQDWFAWMKHAGIPAPAALPLKKLGYESSMLVYQAALCDLGIAIAQLSLVADDLEAGVLTRPFQAQLDMGDMTYYLVIARGRKQRAQVRRFTQWLESISIGGTA